MMSAQAWPETFIFAQAADEKIPDDILGLMAADEARDNGAVETGPPEVAWIRVTRSNLKEAQAATGTKVWLGDWLAFVRVPCRRG